MSGVPLGHEAISGGGTSDWHLAGRQWPGEVVHQVRNPLHVLASLATISDRSWRYMAWRAQIGTRRDLAGYVDAWLWWTHAANQQADYTYRVEDLAAAWGTLMDIVPSLAPWGMVQQGVSRTANSRPHGELTWARIIDTPNGPALADAARTRGNEVEA